MAVFEGRPRVVAGELDLSGGRRDLAEVEQLIDEESIPARDRANNVGWGRTPGVVDGDDAVEVPRANIGRSIAEQRTVRRCGVGDVLGDRLPRPFARRAPLDVVATCAGCALPGNGHGVDDRQQTRRRRRGRRRQLFAAEAERGPANQPQQGLLLERITRCEAGPVVRLVAAFGDRFGVPVESALAAVRAEAPEQHTCRVRVVDGVDDRFDFAGWQEADFADEVGLLAGGLGDCPVDRLGDDLATVGVVVGRDDVDIRVVERLARNAVKRLAVDDQVPGVERLDVGGDLSRPGRAAGRVRCPFPRRRSLGRRGRVRRLQCCVG